VPPALGVSPRPDCGGGAAVRRCSGGAVAFAAAPRNTAAPPPPAAGPPATGGTTPPRGWRFPPYRRPRKRPSAAANQSGWAPGRKRPTPQQRLPAADFPPAVRSALVTLAHSRRERNCGGYAAMATLRGEASEGPGGFQTPQTLRGGAALRQASAALGGSFRPPGPMGCRCAPAAADGPWGKGCEAFPAEEKRLGLDGRADSQGWAGLGGVGRGWAGLGGVGRKRREGIRGANGAVAGLSPEG
jgi:hypothetical protein